MSRETSYQKRKKNERRLRAKDLGMYPSIQKRSYGKRKRKVIISDNQLKLI